MKETTEVSSSSHLLPPFGRLPTSIMPPTPGSPTYELFKGHSYFFAASKEAKESVDFAAMVNKIRQHGGKVETHRTPGLERYLITDIRDDGRLVKLIGKAALVSIQISSEMIS